MDCPRARPRTAGTYGGRPRRHLSLLSRVRQTEPGVQRPGRGERHRYHRPAARRRSGSGSGANHVGQRQPVSHAGCGRGRGARSHRCRRHRRSAAGGRAVVRLLAAALRGRSARHRPEARGERVSAGDRRRGGARIRRPLADGAAERLRAALRGLSGQLGRDDVHLDGDVLAHRNRAVEAERFRRAGAGVSARAVAASRRGGQPHGTAPQLRSRTAHHAGFGGARQCRRTRANHGPVDGVAHGHRPGAADRLRERG